MAFLTIAAGTTAQTQKPSTQPGIITADSTLYPADLAADQAALALGLTSTGSIAYERASEAATAVQRNQSEAAQRALDELNAVAQVATRNDTEGLEKAAAVLNAVQEETPDAADQGLSSALDAIQKAKERKPATPGDAPGTNNNDGVTGNKGRDGMPV